jgi:hypothetical protein
MPVASGKLEQFLTRHFSTAVLGVVAIGLIVRILAALIVADVDPATAKVYEYGEIAASSIAHGGLTRTIVGPDGSWWTFPTALIPPLGIGIWVAVYKLCGVSRLALQIIIGINVMCGCGIVYGCIRIARLLFASATIALLAGLAAAMHPVFIYSVATYHAVNLYVLELLLLFWACSSAVADSRRQALVIGVLFGAVILTRTEYLLLGVALLFGALLRHRRPQLTVISALVALLLVAPWSIRNYLAFGKFVPLANAVGLNLAKGFNPEANGSGSWMDKNFVLDRQFKEAMDSVALTPHYEHDVDDLFRASARQYIAEHPLRSFVQLPVRKFLLFWLFDIYDQQTHSILYQLPLWPIIVFSSIGIVLCWRRGLLRTPDHRSILLLFAAQTLAMLSYAVHARYRMNVEPFLFAYAAAGLVWIMLRDAAGPRLADPRLVDPRLGDPRLQQPALS